MGMHCEHFDTVQKAFRCAVTYLYNISLFGIRTNNLLLDISNEHETLPNHRSKNEVDDRICRRNITCPTTAASSVAPFPRNRAAQPTRQTTRRQH